MVNHENKIETKRIQLGLETSSVAEVRSGLQEGNLVVVSDRAELKDGSLVRPKRVEALAAVEEK